MPAVLSAGSAMTALFLTATSQGPQWAPPFEMKAGKEKERKFEPREPKNMLKRQLSPPKPVHQMAWLI